MHSPLNFLLMRSLVQNLNITYVCRWIVESVLDDWESLDERTSSDMKVAKEKADEERKAKTERIRKLKEER